MRSATEEADGTIDSMRPAGCGARPGINPRTVFIVSAILNTSSAEEELAHHSRLSSPRKSWRRKGLAAGGLGRHRRPTIFSIGPITRFCRPNQAGCHGGGMPAIARRQRIACSFMAERLLGI